MRGKNYLIWMVVFLVFFAGAAVAVFSAKTAQNLLQKQSQTEFQLQVTEITNAIEGRLSRDIFVLYGLRGLFLSSVSVDRSEFDTYVNTVDLKRNYPEIYAISFQELVKDSNKANFVEDVKNDLSLNEEGYPGFKVFPGGERSEYVILKYGYPEEKLKNAFGFDILTDPDRLEAVLAAERTDSLAMSKKINILPDNEPGFQTYLPVFKNGGLLGYVGTIFKTQDFFSTIKKDLRRINWDQVGLQIYEGSGDPTSEMRNLIFGFTESGRFQNTTSHLEKIEILDIAGQKWLLSFEAVPSFGLTDLEKNIPVLFLVVGLLISLFASVILLISLLSRRRALQIAEDMTRDLSESESKFKAVTEATKDAVVVTDSLGVVVLWNKAAELLFGYSAVEVLGKDIGLIGSSAKSRREGKKQLTDFFKAEEMLSISKKIEISIVKKNKNIFDAELMVARAKVKDRWYTVGIIRDVTERKKELEMIKETNEDLQRLNSLMVDREIKMIELKNQLEELNKKYAKG